MTAGKQHAPTVVNSLYERANTLRREGKSTEAIAAYREVIEQNPGYAPAHNNLGITFFDAGRPDEAMACYRRAIELDPAYSHSYNNLGTALAGRHELKEAEKHFRKAIELAPSSFSAYFNLGNCYQEAIRLDEAIAAYERALALAPNEARYRWNYSVALLMAGRYEQGWKEYEARWQGCPELVGKKPPFKQPEWDGGNLNGKTILLLCEQGLGDAIQLIRYAPMLNARGARVLVRCPNVLARLFHGVPGVDLVVSGKTPVPHFDVHRTLLSLPLLFGTTLATVPARVPYVSFDKKLAAAWDKRIGASSGLKVGLVWGGSEKNRADAKRSCPLAAFAPLAKIPGVSFYSLQLGSYAAQAKSPPAGLTLTDWTGEIKDFADTAALVANLDLVISVDTAVAHLAGALGKPVWLLNRYESEWRWLLGREDSPWYPTMRIFRQPRPHDWAAVLADAAKALAKLPKSPGAAPAPDSADDDKPGSLAATPAANLARMEKAVRDELAKSPTAIGHANLAELLKQRGRRDEAIVAYRSAVTLDPKESRMRMSLGNLLIDAEHFEDAAAQYAEAVKLKPGLVAAHRNLASALQKAGRHAEAVQSLRRALELQPGNAELLLALGICQISLQDFGAALTPFREAVKASPQSPDTHFHLGKAHFGLQQLDHAVKHTDRAISLDPANAKYHWALAIALLLKGDYARGWKEYEWRWEGAADAKGKLRLAKPEWNGEDIRGKTILLHCEQGLGDAIQFIRYVPLVAARGARVIVRCPKPLARLFRSVPGIDEISPRETPRPHFDTYRAMLSLPLLFGTRLDTIPRQVPYIPVDKNLVAGWRERIGTSAALKVGLVWGGNEQNRLDAKRSSSLATFAPLARIPAVRFYSLQKGGYAREAKSPPAGLELTDWTDEIGDFADTAALVANLDLVISVDTAVAHLAGALGKPVWLLNRHESEWRWLLEREDSPWYPSMRIFRQPQPDDWSSVISEVAKALRALDGRPPKPSPPFSRSARIADPVPEDLSARLARLEKTIRADLAKSPAATRYADLAEVLKTQGRREDAIANYKKAVQLDPKDSRFHMSLANLLVEAGSVVPAATHYRKAAALKPDLAAAHSNLAGVLLTMGKYKDALKRFEHAITLEPGGDEYQWNHTVALFQLGEYSKGWEKADTWRWRTKRARPKRHQAKLWAGDRSPGSRLLVWGEQGIGDELIYASMIGELADAGLKVTLETDHRLVSLLQRSFPKVHVVARTDPPAINLADFDFQTPSGSLGRWLRPGFESFPHHTGYLKPDPERVATYAARIGVPGKSRVIGLSWASANPDFGHRKTIALDDWTQVLRVPGARFVDLQYGNTAAARDSLKGKGLELQHLDDLDLFNDLEGLAALCAACDLVITTSNVTAHVAGALGKPTWVLLPIGPGRLWYWLAGRADSPWYPSLRIFSQKKLAGWREPLDDVARQLAKFTKTR